MVGQLENLLLTRNIVRLLIADDDPNALAAYELFFDARGYKTRTTGDGADALAKYYAWRPDAVVRDIQMPRLDGRAVAREIRRLQSAPAPLLVAGYRSDIAFRARRINQIRVRSSFCKARRSAGRPRCDSGPRWPWRHG
ncbi:response regulator [Cupriavidus sp. RAF12]|uniref:response regulator n=1 Tax=Cupriavidus sp. RAF12 TaxID=3233050 RepID=UPI003F937596